MSFFKRFLALNYVHRLSLFLTALIYMAIFYGILRGVIAIERHLLGQGQL